jgi:hypothetical protein
MPLTMSLACDEGKVVVLSGDTRVGGQRYLGTGRVTGRGNLRPMSASASDSCSADRRIFYGDSLAAYDDCHKYNSFEEISKYKCK